MTYRMLHFEIGEHGQDHETWAAGCDECQDYISPGPRDTEAEATADGRAHDIDHHMKIRPGWGLPSKVI